MKAARADANQPAIIDALRRIGCQVYWIKEPVDLLVAGGPLGERNVLIECKVPSGDLTANQKMFWLRWPGEKHIVRSVREALEAVMGKDALR